MENWPRKYIFSEASLVSIGEGKACQRKYKEFVLQPLDFSAKFLMWLGLADHFFLQIRLKINFTEHLKQKKKTILAVLKS